MITSEILQETAIPAKVFEQKLKNMRRHLESLAAKKIRIELEMKELKKSIKEKQINYEKSLKMSLSLEADQTLQPLVETGLINAQENFRELAAFEAFDRESSQIMQLLEALDEKHI